MGVSCKIKKNLGNELWVRVVGQELPWSRDACIPPSTHLHNEWPSTLRNLVLLLKLLYATVFTGVQ